MDTQLTSRLRKLETSRLCLRSAIPEIAVAAAYLDEAVSAHISNEPEKAENLINLANMPAIRQWTESIWGKASPYVQYRIVADAPAVIERVKREKFRMPTLAEKQLLHLRDGYHCRFCQIPVIRSKVRDQLKKFYQRVLPWEKTNAMAHAAFQAMWAQYDHVLPHARGGNNSPENILVACAPCNFGRMSFTLDEVGLADPRTREPIRSTWDGLERLLHHSN